MFILSFAHPFENIVGNIITVKANQEGQHQISNCQFLRFWRYRLDSGRTVYEVACPEYTSADGESIIIIPDYLIPKRKYPIYVYIFAINTYCSNTTMGQREAARLTKKQFDLETFSHTTLGRTMKALERSVFMAYATRETKAATAGDCEETSTGEKTANRFPSVEDTAVRRKSLKSFFNTLSVHIKPDIIAASQKLVTHWYDKYRRLLI